MFNGLKNRQEIEMHPYFGELVANAHNISTKLEPAE